MRFHLQMYSIYRLPLSLPSLLLHISSPSTAPQFPYPAALRTPNYDLLPTSTSSWEIHSADSTIRNTYEQRIAKYCLLDRRASFQGTKKHHNDRANPHVIGPTPPEADNELPSYPKNLPSHNCSFNLQHLPVPNDLRYQPTQTQPQPHNVQQRPQQPSCRKPSATPRLCHPADLQQSIRRQIEWLIRGSHGLPARSHRHSRSSRPTPTHVHLNSRPIWNITYTAVSHGCTTGQRVNCRLRFNR